jgi:hypothetical protein
MSIQLNPEQEQVVDLAIHAGLIRVPDDVVGVGVEAIRRQLEVHQPRERALSAEEWSSAFHSWVHGHSTATPVLQDEAMDRESIYGLRGL